MRFWAKVDRSGGSASCWPWKTSARARYEEQQLRELHHGSSDGMVRQLLATLDAARAALWAAEERQADATQHIIGMNETLNEQDKEISQLRADLKAAHAGMRRRTPPAFAEWLVSLARQARPGGGGRRE